MSAQSKVFNIAPSNAPNKGATKLDKNSKTVIKNLIANELIFAVVGPAGSGTSWVAQALMHRAKSAKPNTEVEVTVIKASEVIEQWAKRNSCSIDESSKLSRARSLQDAGDAIRSEDAAGVAVELISAIRDKRTEFEKKAESNGIEPVDQFRVFVIDSLKHPAEVALLRSVYQDAFTLIGVVCESDQREKRLTDAKCQDSSKVEVKGFIARDEDSGVSHGQKVADTFHLADFFVNNTPDRFIEGKENPDWDVNDQLGRLLDILTHAKLVRPRANETGMFHAYGAQLRSACLSRQVGAALTDRNGNLISTGTNEVPRAGGGVYGGQTASSDSDELLHDHRCAYSGKHCSNTRTQDEIVNELISSIPQLNAVADKDQLRKDLKKTTVGRLIEFSRAVHAEMDALLSAARLGASPVGTRLFVTTFPCHYCARHIVSAGVDEVQYIEPYPKSRALPLHGDAIVQTSKGWKAPSVLNGENNENLARKVLFKPFTGVAPRLFRRAFMKDRPLKNFEGNMEFGDPTWASGLLKMSYQEIEGRLVENGAEK